jgi:hypothetical protein
MNIEQLPHPQYSILSGNAHKSQQLLMTPEETISNQKRWNFMSRLYMEKITIQILIIFFLSLFYYILLCVLSLYAEKIRNSPLRVIF